MLTSTFLTLFVVPVVYTFLSDVVEKLRGKPAPPPLPVDAAPSAK